MRSLTVPLLSCLLIMVAGCQKHAATGIQVDPELQKVISPDTKALAGVKLDKLKTTPFYQRYLGQLDIPLLTGMAEQTGFDPRRDLTELVIEWNGKEAVVAGRGRFARDQIERRLSAAASPRKYKAHALFGTENDAVTFLNEQLILAGGMHAVEAAIDLRESGESGMPDELRVRLASLPKVDQLWAVSRGGLPFADIPMRSDYASALSNLVGYVSGTTAGIAVDTSIRVEAEITCVSEAGAKRVQDALRGGVGLARLTTKDNEPDLLRLYDSIHVSQDKQLVNVSSGLPEDLAGKLLNKLIHMRDRAGSAFQPH